MDLYIPHCSIIPATIFIIGNIDAMFRASAVQRTRLFRDHTAADIAACGRLSRFRRLTCLTGTVITDPVIEATIGCIEEGGTISEPGYRATPVTMTGREDFEQ